MELDKAVGTVLRDLRKRKKFTQEVLALEAEVDRNYVSLVELGRNSPSVRMLAKLCAVLNVSASTFLAEVEALTGKAG